MVSDRSISAGSVFAGTVWAVAFLLMTAGTLVGLLDGGHVPTMIMMTHAIFVAVSAAALTMRQCARQNRVAMMEAVRLMSRASDGEVHQLRR